jgi:uncharacterized protein (DUF488 family)
VSQIKIYTIGVYGYIENEFFSRLTENKIDTLVDIRRRRGMRGSKYAFVNSTYLQNKLKELGIDYKYVQDLSPTLDIRENQKVADQKLGSTNQTRNQLDETFIKRYYTECLAHFDLEKFLEQFNTNSRIVLFCVEENPEACHRGLITKKLENFPGIEITHIIGWFNYRHSTFI